MLDSSRRVTIRQDKTYTGPACAPRPLPHKDTVIENRTAPTAALTLLHRPFQARILPRRSSRLAGRRRYPAVSLTSGLHNHGTGLIWSPGNPEGIGLFYYPAPGQGSHRSTSGSKAQAARCNTFESRPRRRLTRLRFPMAPPGSITGAPGNALRASVLIAPTSG
jgi:hypothetical protein